MGKDMAPLPRGHGSSLPQTAHPVASPLAQIGPFGILWDHPESKEVLNRKDDHSHSLEPVEDEHQPIVLIDGSHRGENALNTSQRNECEYKEHK